MRGAEGALRATYGEWDGIDRRMVPLIDRDEETMEQLSIMNTQWTV